MKRSKFWNTEAKLQRLLRLARTNIDAYVGQDGTASLYVGLLPKSMARKDEMEKKRLAMAHAMAAWLGVTVVNVVRIDRPFSTRAPRVEYREPPADAVRPKATSLTRDLAYFGFKAVPTESELKKAWRAAAKKTHPDTGGDADEFKYAREAYERILEVALKDPSAR